MELIPAGTNGVAGMHSLVAMHPVELWFAVAQIGGKFLGLMKTWRGGSGLDRERWGRRLAPYGGHALGADVGVALLLEQAVAKGLVVHGAGNGGVQVGVRDAGRAQ